MELAATGRGHDCPLRRLPAPAGGHLGIHAAGRLPRATSAAPGARSRVRKQARVAFDESQIEFVANPVLSFDEGQTFRTYVLARVLNAAPLVLEILDSRHQMLDRDLQVVARSGQRTGSATCGGPERISAVDLASRPVVSALRLNDIVTGAIMMRRDERMPQARRRGTPFLTNVRKVSTRTRFFHATAIPPHCVNRSGRLIVRDGPDDGESTVVYNDGSIYHRNAPTSRSPVSGSRRPSCRICCARSAPRTSTPSRRHARNHGPARCDR